MGPTRHQQVYIVSILSLILYSTVGILSAYFYYKFVKINRATQDVKTSSPLAAGTVGRFDQAKQYFFLILCVSSFLELPAWVGCLATNGPPSCIWYSPSYLIFWFLHLIALAGFITCIVIPCVLWSDMINKKDGKIFFSNYPYDFIKHYFRLSLIIFYINVALNILVTACYYRLSNRTYYYTAPTYLFTSLVEAIFSLLISIGCAYCGLKLQSYVIQAKLRHAVELKFLFSLNVILIIIVLSLLGRAILIFGLSVVAPKSFEDGISYTVYVFVSRWLPDVFCQLSLIYIMRHSSDEILKKNFANTGNQSATPNTTTSSDRLSLSNNSKFRLESLDSIEYDLEAGHSSDVLSPALVLAKQLQNESHRESLTFTGKTTTASVTNQNTTNNSSLSQKRINSEDSYVLTTVQNPKDVSQLLLSTPTKRFLGSPQSSKSITESVENPITALVRKEHLNSRSETMSTITGLGQANSYTSSGLADYFTTDSLHSRATDASLLDDDDKL
jgi:protein-S-isoprenylcysteine O-methyltransferase Ste14